ncbi:MAG TPA: nucleotidyltransferase domain-containing protein [Kiritimatiellia bacterium]|nr:nucleotidyltransferase domain-containing protein [Kiritimatiellia bacterium]
MIRKSEILKYAHELGRKFSPEKIVLFGSHARGVATRDSDVDLLVIMDHDKPRNVEQAVSIRLQSDAPFPLDLLVRRPSEVAKRLAEKDGFITEVITRGQVLYG